MTGIRCFVAAQLPISMREEIGRLGGRIATDGLRLVRPELVHVTLKFLGDTSPSGIELIQAALEAETNQYTPFDVLLRGFGAFPNDRKPRVLWIGLIAPVTLASLQHQLDVATARLGYSSEERTFSPHLTVGRVRPNIAVNGLQKIRDELEHTAVGELGSFSVDSVQLIKSELQPSGSVYTKLFSAALAKP